MQDTVPRLGDTAGRTDNRLQGQGRAERIDVVEAADINWSDVDDIGGCAEINAAFNEGHGGHVGRSGRKATHTNSQDTARTQARATDGTEGAHIARPVGAIVIKREFAESIIPKEANRSVTIEGDLVARVDCIGRIGQEVPRTDGGAVHDEALGRIRRQRDDAAAIAQNKGTVVDKRPARVSIITR